jgi:SOS-response transcriptional repressor LexA
MIPIENQRFKEIRTSLNFTQSAFALELGIGPTTADIERGRVKLTGNIVKDLLLKYQINPLWLYGESNQKTLITNHLSVSPKTITLDHNGIENIILVNAKAAAGYGYNIDDAQFFEQLPVFSFPLPEFRNASFRGFQVEGDSMLPNIKPGEWVLGKALFSTNEIKNGNVYIVVEKESIRIKKIYKEEHTLKLVSSNISYPTVEVNKSDVLEVWHYHSKISFGFNEEKEAITLQKIYSELEAIKKQLK